MDLKLEAERKSRHVHRDMERIHGPERKADCIPNAHRALREKEAAAYLGLSVKTLQAWRFYCKGPKYIKVGRAVRYPMEYLDQFKESSTVNPVARG